MAKVKNGNLRLIEIVGLFFLILGAAGGGFLMFSDIRETANAGTIKNIQQDKVLEKHDIRFEENRKTDNELLKVINHIDKQQAVMA